MIGMAGRELYEEFGPGARRALRQIDEDPRAFVIKPHVSVVFEANRAARTRSRRPQRPGASHLGLRI